jgi:hypothetical protein
VTHGPQPVLVDLAPGSATVTVDGHTLPDVRRVLVSGGRDGLPVVQVEFVAHDVEVEGLVRAEAVSADGDDRDAVVRFLSSIDAAELDREVLASLEWGSGSPVEVWLAKLIELARGAPA